MQRYSDAVQDRQGNALSGVSVLVRTEAGATATIYSDNGVTAASNPLTTDSEGEFSFYAADGVYTLTFSGGGVVSSTEEIRLIDVRGVPVNVRSYGAIGNGTANDTAVIQAVMDAVKAAGGGVVYFPPGTYAVGNLYLSAASNIELVGAMGAVLSARSQTNDHILEFNACTNITIRGLKILGNSASQTGRGESAAQHSIYFEGCDTVLVDSCTITDSAACCIRSRNTQRTTVRNCDLSDPYFSPIYIGPSSSGGVSVEGVRVVGNHIDWTGVAASVTESAAINIQATTGSGYTIKGVEVSGNFVKQHPTPTTTECACITGRLVTGYVCANNTVMGAFLPLTFAECYDLTVTANTVTQAAATSTYYGIEIGNDCIYTTVSSNAINMTGSSARGVQINGSSDRTTIIGNSIRGVTKGIVCVADSKSASDRSENLVIANNNIISTDEAIDLKYANYVTVTGNYVDASNTGQGCLLSFCDYFHVGNNYFNNCEFYGVQLFSGSAHTINRGAVVGNTFEALADPDRYVRYSLTSGTIVRLDVDVTAAGAPEGKVYGSPGSIWRRTDGGASTTLYVKESGVGNTGWVAK